MEKGLLSKMRARVRSNSGTGRGRRLIILSWQKFGAALLDTGDLDPIYIMLYKAKLEPSLLKRWLLAYWCFYNSATATRIAEGRDFWQQCQLAYDEKWPRGAERRHFRGETCLKSLESLRKFGPPEFIVDYLATSRTYAEVEQKVGMFYGFGPWITWKIADMLERVLAVPVDFSNTSLNIYSEPRKGAALIKYSDANAELSDSDMEEVLLDMQLEFHDYTAPPRYDRALNIQEFETCLCKSKSHFNRHYPVGKDIKEIRESLEKMPERSDIIELLLKALPPTPVSLSGGRLLF
jgi:hypothetical protein